MTGTALAVALAALGFGAAPALAATVTATPATVIVDGDARNDVITVTSPGAGTFVIDSAAAITAGSPQCVAQSASRVVCTAPGLSQLLVRGADGNDTITNDTAFPSNLQGQVGDDVITGGAGDDVING